MFNARQVQDMRELHIVILALQESVSKNTIVDALISIGASMAMFWTSFNVKTLFSLE